MKLEINIGKMHFWILLAVIVLIGITAIAFAAAPAGVATHATLYTDAIAAKGSGPVTVSDNLVIGSGKTISGDGSALTGVNAAKLNGKLESQLNVPWGGITGMPSGFSDGVDNTGGVNSVSIDYTDCQYTCHIGSDTVDIPGSQCSVGTGSAGANLNCPNNYIAVGMFFRYSSYLDYPTARAVKCCKLKVT